VERTAPEPRLQPDCSPAGFRDASRFPRRPFVPSEPDWSGEDANGNIDNYINPATVVVPTDQSQPFGNAGRNVVRGYSFFQLDLGIGKSFTFMERYRLQFRSEMFNATNHTNFRNANLNRSTAGFGQVRAAFPARQVQFGLRFVF